MSSSSSDLPRQRLYSNKKKQKNHTQCKIYTELHSYQLYMHYCHIDYDIVLFTNRELTIYFSELLQQIGASDRDGHVNMVDHKQRFLYSVVGQKGQGICQVQQQSKYVLLQGTRNAQQSVCGN